LASIDELWRYDGRRVVVTGCASGIGEHVVRQLTELGADVVGLDKRPPTFEINDFHEVDLADPSSIDGAVMAVGDAVDALFNIAGVSSGIGNPSLIVTINFLGLRHVTEALIPKMAAGSSIVSVSSLAAAAYREHLHQVAPLLGTAIPLGVYNFTEAMSNRAHEHALGMSLSSFTYFSNQPYRVSRPSDNFK